MLIHKCWNKNAVSLKVKKIKTRMTVVIIFYLFPLRDGEVTVVIVSIPLRETNRLSLYSFTEAIRECPGNCSRLTDVYQEIEPDVCFLESR